jgi:hypothetical protein
MRDAEALAAGAGEGSLDGEGSTAGAGEGSLAGEASAAGAGEASVAGQGSAAGEGSVAGEGSAAGAGEEEGLARGIGRCLRNRDRAGYVVTVSPVGTSRFGGNYNGPSGMFIG